MKVHKVKDKNLCMQKERWGTRFRLYLGQRSTDRTKIIVGIHAADGKERWLREKKTGSKFIHHRHSDSFSKKPRSHNPYFSVTPSVVGFSIFGFSLIIRRHDSWQLRIAAAAIPPTVAATKHETKTAASFDRLILLFLSWKITTVNVNDHLRSW